MDLNCALDPVVVSIRSWIDSCPPPPLRRLAGAGLCGRTRRGNTWHGPDRIVHGAVADFLHMSCCGVSTLQFQPGLCIQIFRRVPGDIISNKGRVRSGSGLNEVDQTSMLGCLREKVLEKWLSAIVAVLAPDCWFRGRQHQGGFFGREGQTKYPSCDRASLRSRRPEKTAATGRRIAETLPAQQTA